MSVKMLKGVVLAALLVSSAAQAQSLKQIGGPANAPPAGFQGQQFVDSRGCLFLRAGYGAGVNWVARVDRTHKPICNMMPTGGAAAQAALAADMAPDPQAVAQPPTVMAATAPVVQGASVAVQVPVRQIAAPAPGPKPTVVASTPAQPTHPAPTRQASPAYQGMAVATSVAGVQCFDTAPVLERVNVSGGTALVCTRGDGSTSGWLPPRMAGAAQARVAAQTVPPVAAPVYAMAPAARVASQTVPVQVYAVPQPLARGSHALPKPPKGWVYAWKDDRLNPLRGVGTAEGQAQQDQVWQRTIPMVLLTEPPPQTAFQHSLGIHPKVAAKLYPTISTTVSTMSASPVAQPASSTSVSVMQVSATPAAPQAPGALLVQVGCFADPANAQAVVARLSSLGLPVTTARTTRNGATLQIVYAGPFASGPEASSGLSTVHRAGYADAFLR